ncbi:MAG: hypothetical protein HC896_11965 [Bacteroidales bacterium]|nr:hypothetical protein [Bacteroidales bacterium]
MISEGSPESWVNFSSKTWNATKIATVLNNMPVSGASVMINIPGPMPWMDLNNDGKVDDDLKWMYANWCAALVKVVNKDMGKKIVYWEPINEPDHKYSGSSDMYHLADLFKQCYDAMKAVDGTIKVGGPAWSQPWDADIDHFLYNMQGSTKIDFWTHHEYFGCGITDITEIYGKDLSWGANNVRAKLDAKGFNSLPIWIDEYNIQWAWDCGGSANMTNAVGAVFDALIFKRAIENGNISRMAAWNAADGTYGKIRSDFSALTPGGQVYKAFNAYGRGDVKKTTTSDAAKVEGYAVKASNGNMMFALMCKNASASAKLNVSGFTPASTSVLKRVISGSGVTESTVTWSQATSTQSLSANTVTILLPARQAVRQALLKLVT